MLGNMSASLVRTGAPKTVKGITNECMDAMNSKSSDGAIKWQNCLEVFSNRVFQVLFLMTLKLQSSKHKHADENHYRPQVH